MNTEARRIHSFRPPFLTINEDSTIAFTWAHNDEIVIVSSNGGLVVGRVQPEVPPLNTLVAHQLWLSMGRTAREAGRLGLPERLTNMVKSFDRHVIRCRIPSYERMCRFVCEFFRICNLSLRCSKCKILYAEYKLDFDWHGIKSTYFQ